MKDKVEYTLKELNKQISEIYYNDIKIFLKIKTIKLISHRKENHEISLMLEIELSFIKNYRLMFEQKLIAIRKYLNEHLVKEFIRSSSLKTIASMLLIRKSNENLRFCVDYRDLNNITKKSRYLISLISETLSERYSS